MKSGTPCLLFDQKILCSCFWVSGYYPHWEEEKKENEGAASQRPMGRRQLSIKCGPKCLGSCQGRAMAILISFPLADKSSADTERGERKRGEQAGNEKEL